MDVRESIEGARGGGVEVPRLALIEPERGRRRRIPLALVLAVIWHLLAFVGVVRLGTRHPDDGDSMNLAATPTPVRIIFYETKPKKPEAPPPATEVLSDRTSRARSEVAPVQPAPTRLPAAIGQSPDERRPAAVDKPPAPAVQPAPVPAPPAPAATPQPESVAEKEPGPRAPYQDEVTATRTGLSPALRVSGPEGGARPASGGAFDASSLDQAIRHQGFGNLESGVGDTGGLEFDAKDFEWGPYARKIYEIVDRNWKSVMPLAARMPGVSGKVRLRFRILRNGTVEALELLLSSSRGSLDQAAMASIVMSNPLPPLPPEFPRDDVGVTFSYYYNLPAGAGE